MSTSILGKWRGVAAPFKIEFFSDGTCEYTSPADVEMIYGHYQEANGKIRIFESGTQITFEIRDGAIFLLPPSGSTLPPLEFEKA